MRTPRVVLVLGSGPAAVAVRNWDVSRFAARVAINNAWRLRDDFTHAIYPEDFPVENHPTCRGAQVTVETSDYVPAQNAYGGFVFAGGTMAFTAGYWALHALKPDVLAFFGCDMVYPPSGKTHFYGEASADPLRDDVTLQSLEAKAARLGLLAARAGVACVNLSQDESRLVFPQVSLEGVCAVRPCRPDLPAMARAEAREAALGYIVPSGRYWEVADQFDPAALREVDALWLKAWERSWGRAPEPVGAAAAG